MNETGRVMYDQQLDGLKEVRDGVWLPTKLVRHFPDIPRADMSMVVSSMSVDPLPDEFFGIELIGPTLVVDQTLAKPLPYLAGPGSEDLSNVLPTESIVGEDIGDYMAQADRDAVRYLENAGGDGDVLHGGARDATHGGDRRLEPLLAAAAAILVLLGAGAVLWRRRNAGAKGN